METTTKFLIASEWAGIVTLVCAVIAILAFLFRWGIRFRLIGATGFLGVLTTGLFALSLVPITRTVVPGGVRFSRVYDSGVAQVVIALPPTITEAELSATLRQAASDLFSPGRLSQGEKQLTIRARTLLHPEPGVSEPLYLGQIKRSLSVRNDPNMETTIYHENLARLPHAA
jgi:hypothetical protein